ncbi:MAG: hypothetical protein M3406_02710 [Chloroflexota bacterium]|nr:hypothetical protein [Chloroflexota bacterium]
MSYFAVFLQVMSPLQFSQAERAAQAGDLGPLNRHAVMHGIDLRYPTEINSLRALALLDFLEGLQRLRSAPQTLAAPGLSIALTACGMVWDIRHAPVLRPA